MDGYRVFLRGPVKHRHVLAALEMLQAFDVLDGPVGPVDIVGVRDDVLAEFVYRRREENWYGLTVSEFPMMVRFCRVSDAGRAWAAAHAFLWTVTHRYAVDDALLIGADTEPLRFREGRILPVPAPEERYSED